MKIFSTLRLLALLVTGLIIAVTRADAQSLGLHVTTSANPIAIGTPLTYTIAVTNLTGTPQNITVSNIFFSPVTFLNNTNPTLLTIFLPNGNTFTFGFGLDVGGIAQMSLTVGPTVTGTLTNLIAVYGSVGLTNGVGAYVLTTVTNVIRADLAVGMTAPVGQVFSNDWMAYGVSVTNLGPGVATSVYLTNTLPTNVMFRGVAPSNQTYTVVKSNVIFSLGTLTNQAVRNFRLTVQPTNAGTLTFTSVVSTNETSDTNSANNSANISVVVSNFLSDPGQLTATIVSTQKFNPLSSRLEQVLVVSNAGPASVDAARLIVTGLTNRLYNAVGTNNGNPFVTHAAALAAGESVFLLLQFYPNQSAFTFTNGQLQAVGVTVPDLSLVTTGLMSTNATQFTNLSSGVILLRFPSLPNRVYTVAYSTNMTDWLVAQPLTTAHGNYMAWFDYGPPGTVSHPTNSPARFYQVFLNP
jgi:uncharacterized repeat protein (TIGR01451 family)